MLRTTLLLLLLTLVGSASGCAMCAAPDDYNYAAYGGSWQRDDMGYGRVGSILDAGGVQHVEHVELLPPGESVLSDSSDPAFDSRLDESIEEPRALGESEPLPPPSGPVEPNEPQSLLPPDEAPEPSEPLPMPMPPADQPLDMSTFPNIRGN